MVSKKVDTGKCIVLVFLIFCTYSIIRKIISLFEIGLRHDMSMDKINTDLKVEKIESFEDIKEGDLEK